MLKLYIVFTHILYQHILRQCTFGENPGIIVTQNAVRIHWNATKVLEYIQHPQNIIMLYPLCWNGI